MIRDANGIIMQYDPSNPNPVSGGDSAARTGLAALSGSAQDAALLHLFVIDKLLVRHPFEAGSNDPTNTSRDQLVPFIAGCKLSGNVELAKKLRQSYGWRINNDVLDPGVQLHMDLCSNRTPILSLLGYPWLILSILWACYIAPDHELNQLMSQCLVAGRFYVRLLCRLYPGDWKSNFTTYFNGWRDLPDLCDMIIKRVEQELK